MIRTTAQQQLFKRLASSAAASGAAKTMARAFTGAALSDCAYFHIGDGDDVVNSNWKGSSQQQDEEQERGGETAYSLSFANDDFFANGYASNGFLSPVMRRQLDLCGSPSAPASSATTTTPPPSVSMAAFSTTAATATAACPEALLIQDFEEEERLLIQQRKREMHTLAMAEDDEVMAAAEPEETEVWTAQHHEADPIDSLPLPKTLSAALHPSESRPIVVTSSSSPFRVIDVNSAWEGLCGYSRSQASGKTLGELLGGPETDERAATGLITSLLRGEQEAGTVLMNYKGDESRSKFRNRVRVGPLRDEGATDVKHFVGVLREIQEGQ